MVVTILLFLLQMYLFVFGLKKTLEIDYCKKNVITICKLIILTHNKIRFLSQVLMKIFNVVNSHI